jgi:hypothetical protein
MPKSYVGRKLISSLHTIAIRPYGNRIRLLSKLKAQTQA